MLDILISGGKYPDFAKNELVEANVGIERGKITFIGAETPQSRETIDAKDMIVSPGFIDIHMHEEDFIREGESYVIAEMMLKMGVTTAVGGNCGIQRQRTGHFKEIIEKLGGSPINYMLLAGYNQRRYELDIPRHQPASEEQRYRIKKELEKELEGGACGISFGIEYDPGISTDEIIGILKSFDDKNLLAAAHYRSSCVNDTESIEEMIKIASEITMKFQISHLSSCSAMGKMKESLDLIRRASSENPRLDFDTYPYNAFSTTLGSEVFEPGCLERWKKDYDCILLTGEPYKDVRCDEEIFKNARRNYPDMLAVVFAMNEEEIKEALTCPAGMIASDGIINSGKGHPRAAGTFPRVLSKYVREEKAIKLTDALAKMTVKPAERLGLKRKGRIELGCDADIVLFDPDKIADTADFTDLSPWPEGIEYVFISGSKAVVNKKISNGRLGKFIKSQDR